MSELGHSEYSYFCLYFFLQLNSQSTAYYAYYVFHYLRNSYYISKS